MSTLAVDKKLSSCRETANIVVPIDLLLIQSYRFGDSASRRERGTENSK